MISIIAHGIMGTRYQQMHVVDDDKHAKVNITSLYDIRHLLSTQYGDDTPMIGWAMQPAPDGMWLSRIERAFDANFSPAYVMVSFFIPQGYILPEKAISSINSYMMLNHSKYVQQSVVRHDADWKFLEFLGQQLDGLADLSMEDDADFRLEFNMTNNVAYYPGEISTMLQNMWDKRFRRFGIVFCGNKLLSQNRIVMSIDDVPSYDNILSEENFLTDNLQVDNVEIAHDVESFAVNMENSKNESNSSDSTLEHETISIGYERNFSDHKIDYPSNNAAEKTSARKKLGNLFSFKGEIGRMSYCMTLYGSFLGFFVVFLFSFGSITPYFLVLILPLLWLLYAQGAKRCHNLGHSGWFQLIPFYVFPMMLKGTNTSGRKYTKDVLLIITAAFFALIIPLAVTGFTNQFVAKLTHQWYLSGVTRVLITICITSITYLLSYLVIRLTIVKRSILFNLISLALTFLWCVAMGIIYMPD